MEDWKHALNLFKNKKMLSYSKQYIDKKDKKAVLEVLTSDFLTQGPKIQNLKIKKFQKN